MPELPEIEIVKRSLFKKINKAKIVDVKINNRNLRYKIPHTFSKKLIIFNLIYLKGSIPGSKNTLVFLKNSVKKINKKTILEKNKIVEKQDKNPKK